MKKAAICFLCAVVLFVLSGCGSLNTSQQEVVTIGNPTAGEVLSLNPEANIFMYSDTIYMADVEWVNELELTKDRAVTEIVKQTNDVHEFENGTANHLKAGTKIYRVKERGDILIAETEEGDVRFYQLVEG